MYIVTSTTQLRKTFKNSKDDTSYSSSFSLVRDLSSPSLSDIYSALSTIEKNDLNHAILAGKPASSHFRKRYAELEDVARNWVQLDCDLELPGANSLTLSERLAKLAEMCPLFEMPFGYVAQLSSKAGLTAYPDRLALRLYVTLSKPLRQVELEALLKPLSWFDYRMALRGQLHFVRKPLLIDTPAQHFEESILLKDGPGLDVDAVRQSEFFQQATKKETHRTHVRTSLINGTSIDADSLREAAAKGLFEGRRHEEHFNLIASAIWRSGDAKPIINLIESIPEVLGKNRSRETLESQEAYCHQKNFEYFCPEIEEIFRNLFQYDCLDLGDADLSELIGLYKSEDFNGVVLCKSPHGSGKTSALVNRFRSEMELHFKRPIRILYISTLRSVIRKNARDLDLVCYIDDGDNILKEVIIDSENLAICIMSLDKLADCEKPFDFVVIDECEQMMDWSALQKNQSNWNYLIDVCRRAKTCLLMDADVSLLSAFVAFEISKKPFDYILNKKSYIREQSAFLLQYEHDFIGKLMDYVDDEKSIVWVNVDYSDKGQRIKALVEYINSEVERKIAVGFDGERSRPPAKFFEDPDTLIPQMIEEGIRIFITSPVVATGWRYKGFPRFDVTLSSYSYGIQTAPAIVQQIQRCVGVKEHFLYIGPPSYRIPKGLIREAYEEESFRRTGLFELDYFNKIRARAKQKLAQEKSNIRLHFKYLWEDYYGGRLLELHSVYGEEVKKDLARIKGERQELIDEEAKEHLKNPHKNHLLLNLFPKSTKATTKEEILKLLASRDKFKKNEEAIKLFVSCIFFDEKFCSLFFEDSTINSIYEYFGKDITFLPELRKLFSLLIQEVIEASGIPDIPSFFLNRKNIIVHTNSLNQNPTILRFISENRHWLNDRLGINKSVVKPDKILKELLSRYLDIEFKYKDKKVEGLRKLPEIKNDLINTYKKNNFIFSSRAVGDRIKVIEKCIHNKLLNDQALLEIEEEYLTVSERLIYGYFKKSYVVEIDKIVASAIERGLPSEPVYESIL